MYLVYLVSYGSLFSGMYFRGLVLVIGIHYVREVDVIPINQSYVCDDCKTRELKTTRR